MKVRRVPSLTPQQRQAAREDYARGLRQLQGQPEAQPVPPRQLAPDEKCVCGGPALLVGGRRICASGRHDD